ncbi:mitochondrial 54S ribosomal protein uL24m [Phyllosticta citribraziliensis]|uniref:KOW domain-containing protein n=1 Tax=Phyllosticta citribraziliensis TaxID=989973 RepID=A0ABR1LB26_9PEZI
MQKVLQRTAMAKRQAARKAEIAAEKKKLRESVVSRLQSVQVNQKVADQVREARRHRRENWELGPLAPRRDVGGEKKLYGTVVAERMRQFPVHPDRRLKFTPFATGDRVVLLKGRDKGKIGEIKEVHDESQTLTISGLNTAEVPVPDHLQGQPELGLMDRPYRTIEIPTPFAEVRLVYPLPDPKTGIKRDVIIQNVVREPVIRDDKVTYRRYIPGTKIEIPWKTPKRTEYADQPADTLRILVDERSFVPTLLRPPMPNSVINELRNQFSYFRDRHDPEYVARKVAEDELQKGKGVESLKMMTPLKELNARIRRANRARGRQPIDRSVLAAIGERMAIVMEKNSAKKSAKSAARA